MANVLGNALKFTLANGQIHVTAKFERQNWIIEVHDSGIGISTEDLRRVTNSFTRGSLESPAMASDWLSLGMYSSSAASVALHHGTLDIDSALNVGTTVRITLPVILASP
jgi:signal transduction histidine kinase